MRFREWEEVGHCHPEAGHHRLGRPLVRAGQGANGCGRIGDEHRLGVRIDVPHLTHAAGEILLHLLE